MDKEFLNVTELSLEIGASTHTIGNWYRFKAENPDHPLSKKLPEFVRMGTHRTRYWRAEDIPGIIEFREAIPQGRGGLMGSVTQKYVNKTPEDKMKSAKVTCEQVIKTLEKYGIETELIYKIVLDLAFSKDE